MYHLHQEAEPSDRTALEAVVDHVKEEIERLNKQVGGTCRAHGRSSGSVAHTRIGNDSGFLHLLSYFIICSGARWAYLMLSWMFKAVPAPGRYRVSQQGLCRAGTCMGSCQWGQGQGTVSIEGGSGIEGFEVLYSRHGGVGGESVVGPLTSALKHSPLYYGGALKESCGHVGNRPVGIARRREGRCF